MKLNIFKTTAFALLTTVLFAACGDDAPPPKPIEQELITTVKLHVTGASFDKTFSYKVENGFNNSTPGTVAKDDVTLEPNKEYNVSIMLLNEKESPAEDITSEVVAESNDHLFLWQSNPSSGAGAVTIEQGSKDAAGNAFNQTVVFKTAATGNGEITITLKHEPTDKNATTPDAAGGETDVEATFSVKIQ